MLETQTQHILHTYDNDCWARTIYSTFYENQLDFVEDITENSLLCFFQFTVYVKLKLLPLQLKYSFYDSTLCLNTI